MAQNRFKQLREEHGLSQIELGNRLNVTQQSVFAWEHGKSSPQIQTAIQLCQLYGVSLDYLMGLSDTPKTKEPAAMADDELLADVISRIQDLPDPALSRVADFLDGLQAGREVAAAQAAAPDPAEGSRS